jgi:hypothetical protein
MFLKLFDEKFEDFRLCVLRDCRVRFHNDEDAAE